MKSAILAILVLLAACGGGGDEPETNEREKANDPPVVPYNGVR